MKLSRALVVRTLSHIIHKYFQSDIENKITFYLLRLILQILICLYISLSFEMYQYYHP